MDVQSFVSVVRYVILIYKKNTLVKRTLNKTYKETEDL